MVSGSKKFRDKVAVIGVGLAPACFGIVARLLQLDAIVIVLAQSSHHLQLLQHYVAGIHTGRLITLLTDFPDYDKAVAVTDAIQEEFGTPDIIVFSYDYTPVSVNLFDINIARWERAVEENLAAYFICGRVAINAMKKKGTGMFAAISDIDGLVWQHDALAGMRVASQLQMARSFFEEVKNTGVRFYQLFINNLAVRKGRHTAGGKAITPGMIGEYMLRLYDGKIQQGQIPFLFLLGRPDLVIHQYAGNH
jgi:NAD(P)-dependent dehydrogenase (short-subunit alcohol dehydrogenase family)